ncbi:MAG: hypothetical protein JXA23_10730 [Bacteroidales bacterium]|nr:hypothetical protein [Bacteroidales bacterium]
MIKCTTVFLFIFYFCVFIACENSGETRVLPQIHAERIHDSIVTLDSLAALLVFKDPDLATEYVNKAIDLAKEAHSTELLIRSLNIKGRVMSGDQFDSAFYYYTLALAISDSNKIFSEKAYILYNLSRLYFLASDYRSSIVLLDSSIRIGESLSIPAAISASLIALGNIFLITEEYQQAKSCYDSALHIALKEGLNREAGVAYANLAQFQANNDSGIAYLRKSLIFLNRQKGTEEEQVNSEINLAMRLQDPDSAICFYRGAIVKANAYHLPIATLGAYNNLVYKYMKKGLFAKAERCLRDTAIPLALSLKNYDWLATLYDTYSDVLILNREFEKAITTLRQSIETRALSDRIIAEKQIRILNAVLELNNKNLLITEKEKLLIQKDRWLAQMHFWLAFAGVLILAATGLIFWIKQRAKNRLQRTKLTSARQIIEAEEREKEKNAMELHDSMNLLISKVSNTIQSLPQIDRYTRKAIEDYFAEFSSNVRSISHRLNKKILEKHPFHSLVKGMCEDAINYSHLRIIYLISDAPPRLPVEITIHFIRMIQELLANARKYAPQAEIKLIVRFPENRIELVYSDNGPGFTYKAEEIAGMGIANIFSRANLINGKAEINTEPGHGVYWIVRAPIVEQAETS